MISVECKNCPKVYMTYPSKGNKKIFCSHECRIENLSKRMIGNKFAKGQPRGEKSSNWKGDAVGYWGIHKWIARVMGRPMFCTHCKTKTARKYEWANISGKYLRDISDWVRLCSRCHINFDNGNIVIS